jgi:hypothetical protein
MSLDMILFMIVKSFISLDIMLPMIVKNCLSPNMQAIIVLVIILWIVMRIIPNNMIRILLRTMMLAFILSPTCYSYEHNTIYAPALDVLISAFTCYFKRDLFIASVISILITWLIFFIIGVWFHKKLQDKRSITTIKRPFWIKILIWLVAFIISGFYITSALGWVMATQMMFSGTLGKDALDFYQCLSVADHAIRTSQVILIIVASLFLIFLKRIALKLFIASFLVSLFSTIFVYKWGISFLAGSSLLILAPVCCFVYWINHKGFLS